MERYICRLSNGTSFVNFDAILRKLQLFSDGRLGGEGGNLCIVLPYDHSIFCLFNAKAFGVILTASFISYIFLLLPGTEMTLHRALYSGTCCGQD